MIVITSPPSKITPDDPTSYFPESKSDSLIEWSRAHQAAPGKDRKEIPSGTQIAVLAEVRQAGNGQLSLIVANAPCMTDSFWLPETTQQDKAALQPYVGTMVAAMLVIRERHGDQSCHGSRYIVEPNIMLAPLPLNPTLVQLRNMAPGAHFVVQGTFACYYEVTPGKLVADTKDYKTRGRIVIDTPGGQLTLDSARPRKKEPCYEGGVLENLRDKPMTPGEIIRITGCIASDSQDKLAAGTPTVEHNRAYLLVPDAERLANYTELRELVQTSIDDHLLHYVDTQQWELARREFAQLRELELTSDESRRIIQIMEEVPAEHRSVYYTRLYGADDIRRAYGIDPETLNRLEFLAYAREILHGVRENPSRGNDRRTDPSYVLRFWDTKSSVLRSEDLFNLLVSTIPVRFARLKSTGDEFDEKLLLEQCMSFLRNEKEDIDPRLVRAIIAIIEECFDKKYYVLESESPRNSQCPRRLSNVMRDCFRALADGWMCQPIVREFITPQVVAAWTTRLNDAGAQAGIIDELRRRVPRR